MVELSPDGPNQRMQRDRVYTVFERASEVSFLAYVLFAFVYRVPALENATFLLASMAAGVCAARQRQRLRLATAVLSSIFAVGVIGHSL